MVAEAAGGRVGTRYMCMLMSYGKLLFQILTENLITGKKRQRRSVHFLVHQHWGSGGMGFDTPRNPAWRLVRSLSDQLFGLLSFICQISLASLSPQETLSGPTQEAGCKEEALGTVVPSRPIFPPVSCILTNRRGSMAAQFSFTQHKLEFLTGLRSSLGAFSHTEFWVCGKLHPPKDQRLLNPSIQGSFEV